MLLLELYNNLIKQHPISKILKHTFHKKWSDDNTENEYDTAVDETAERESLGPENGPAQRTRQRLARGAGSPAVLSGELTEQKE